MKTLLCFSVISLLVLQGMGYTQNYKTGDILYVVANSGLRLRTSPGQNTGTIRVLGSGEAVVVSNTFGFDSAYQDQAGWFDGHWISVNMENVSGYVFDAFLSSLELPSHEDEFCIESLNFTTPVHTYINNHYPLRYDEQGPETREDVDQCITFHEGGIMMTSTIGEGWQKTDLVFQGYRLSEVVNLFRGMIVDKDLSQVFQDSMKFYKNNEGHMHRVQMGSEVRPVLIEKKRDGNIHVSFIELNIANGC